MISVVGRSDGTTGVGLSRRLEERDERDRETDEKPKQRVKEGSDRGVV